MASKEQHRTAHREEREMTNTTTFGPALMFSGEVLENGQHYLITARRAGEVVDHWDSREESWSEFTARLDAADLSRDRVGAWIAASGCLQEQPGYDRRRFYELTGAEF